MQVERLSRRQSGGLRVAMRGPECLEWRGKLQQELKARRERRGLREKVEGRGEGGDDGRKGEEGDDGRKERWDVG